MAGGKLLWGVLCVNRHVYVWRHVQSYCFCKCMHFIYYPSCVTGTVRIAALCIMQLVNYPACVTLETCAVSLLSALCNWYIPDMCNFGNMCSITAWCISKLTTMCNFRDIQY